MKRLILHVSIVSSFILGAQCIFGVATVGAQTPNNYCYSYRPSTSAMVSVDLISTSGQSQTISIPNQNPPSILQEIDFGVDDPDCALYGHIFTHTLYLDTIVSGQTVAFAGSPFEIEPLSFDPTIDLSLPAPVYSYYYAGLKDIGLGQKDNQNQINKEDALINSIDNSHKFVTKMSTEYGSTIESVLATNCVALNNGGSNKIVFMRSAEWNSSVSDFLIQALALKNQLLSSKPYSDNVRSYSFFADLKKQPSNPYDMTSGAEVSSCGKTAKTYMYVVPPPVLSGIIPMDVIEPMYGKPIRITGSGFSPKGNNVIQLINATSGLPLYEISITKRDENDEVLINDTQNLYSDFKFVTNLLEGDSVGKVDIRNKITSKQSSISMLAGVGSIVPIIIDGGTDPRDGNYLMRVSASNSVWSNNIPITINTTPKPPTNLVAIAKKKGEIELNWKEGHPRGYLASYLVEKKMDGVFVQLPLVPDLIKIGSTTLQDYPPSTAATFRVRAAYHSDSPGFTAGDENNSEDRSEYTNSVTVTTLPKTRAPILLATAGPNSSIVLSWVDLDNKDVKHYELTGHSEDGSLIDIADNIDKSTFAYTVEGVDLSKKYCYTISSYVNKNNESDPSNTACAIVTNETQEGTILSSDPTTAITGSDTVNFSSSDSTISSVDLVVDGKTVATDKSAPWSFNFDSSQFDNGPGQIFVIINRPGVAPIATKPLPIVIKNPVNSKPVSSASPTPTYAPNSTPSSTTTAASKPVERIATYTCPSDYTLSSDNSSCYKPASTITTPASTVAATVSGYTCVDGKQPYLYMNSWMCRIDGTVNKYEASPKYSCPAGGTFIASRQKNGKWENNVCDMPAVNTVTPASNVSPTVTYSCPTGYTLKDTSCVKSTTVKKMGIIPTEEVTQTNGENNSGTSFISALTDSIFNITGAVVNRVTSVLGYSRTSTPTPSPSPSVNASQVVKPRAVAQPVISNISSTTQKVRIQNGVATTPMTSLNPSINPSVSPKVSPAVVISPSVTVKASPSPTTKTSPLGTPLATHSPTPTPSPSTTVRVNISPTPTTSPSPTAAFIVSTPRPTPSPTPSQITVVATPSPSVSSNVSPSPSPTTSAAVVTTTSPSPSPTSTINITPTPSSQVTTSPTSSPSPVSYVGKYSVAAVFGVFGILSNLFVGW